MSEFIDLEKARVVIAHGAHTDYLRVGAYVFANSDAGKIAAAVLEAGGVEEHDSASADDGDVFLWDMHRMTVEDARSIALDLLRSADVAEAEQNDSTNENDELVERVARGLYAEDAYRLGLNVVWSESVNKYPYRERAREILKEDD